MPRAAALAITAGTGSVLVTLIAGVLWALGNYEAADALALNVSLPLAAIGWVALLAIPIRSK